MRVAEAGLGKPSLLELGNARKVKKHLAAILDDDALVAIEREIEGNVRQLRRLAGSHYRFAVAQPPAHWRQKVSRLYFAAYAGSRAVRLYVEGHFSTEVKDHKKIGDLPDDFPLQPTYANRLEIMREDRNLADYDHTSRAPDLAIASSDAARLVGDFLSDVDSYLRGKGLRAKE